MRKFFHNTHGGVLILAALTLPAALGFGALAVDVAYAYFTKTSLQNAADAAALAAASRITDQSGAIAAAKNLAAMNVGGSWGQVVADTDVVFGNYAAGTGFVAGGAKINAVKVTARRMDATRNAAPGFLGKAMGFGQHDIAASSIAVSFGGPSACMIALDPSANLSFQISGGGTISVPNCGVYVNSNAAAPLEQKGSGGLSAKSIQVVGGYSGANFSPTPLRSQPVIADPLASVPEPVAPSTCTYNNYTFSTSQTLPGGSVYCGKIVLNADVNFGPGIHYFKAATVSTSSNVNITGKNVTLYFDDTSVLTSTSSGAFQLSAPDGGTYKGIAIFGSRAGKLSTFSLMGTKDYYVEGTIYLPTVALSLTGNVDMTVSSKSGYVIAQQFFYSGNSSFIFDASGGIAPEGLGNTFVALVQ